MTVAPGIGKMLAKGFTANGANVILIDVNENALASTKLGLEGVAKSADVHLTTVIVSSNGPPDFCVVPDIVTFRCSITAVFSSRDGVKYIEKIKPTRTSLTVLTHCAAIRYMNKIEYKQGDDLPALEKATNSLSYQDLDHAFRVNVFAPYYVTTGLINPLGAASKGDDGRGCVILFSSQPAFTTIGLSLRINSQNLL